MSLLIFSEIFTIFEITKLMLTHHCKLILSNKYSQYILINTLQNTEIFQTNSVIIIDPLTGVNASKSSFKIDDIQRTFFQAFNLLSITKSKYDSFLSLQANNYSSKSYTNFVDELYDIAH